MRQTFQPSAGHAIRFGAFVVIAAYGASLCAQALTPAVAGGTPEFTVASVKENENPDGPRLFSAQPGGGVTLVNQTVRGLIYSSYQTQDYRIVGGPEWLNTVGFDINAKAEPDTPLPQRLVMIRMLLADRFKLVMHADRREMPIYTMTMANKPGPALKPSTCVVAAPNAPAPADRTLCGNRAAAGRFGAGGGTMDTLANQLGRLGVIGRPVVNRTGLAGVFDYEVAYDANQGPVDAAASTDRVSIFTAVQEQLGVTLQSSRGLMDVLVIDSVSRPSPD